MRRRWAGIIAAAVLLTWMAAGCENHPSSGRGEDPPSAAAAAEASGTYIARGKFEPPVVITTAKALRDSDTLKFGDTVENNPITRWARDKLGIIQQNKWIVADQNEALATKIRLALTGGEELPDVLFITNHDLPELLGDLVSSGKIMDIGEAFSRYASPRVKEA